eukprot:10650809-Ditylum_brightwellii.AAC.1
MEELCLHIEKEMWKQQKNKTAALVNDDEDDDIEETSDDGKKEKEMPKAWYFIVWMAFLKFNLFGEKPEVQLTCFTNKDPTDKK